MGFFTFIAIAIGIGWFSMNREMISTKKLERLSDRKISWRKLERLKEQDRRISWRKLERLRNK